MISCYLLFCELAATAKGAFEFFANKRGIDEANIMPSQKRWVGYYQEYLANGNQYDPKPLLLSSILVNRLPQLGQQPQQGFSNATIVYIFPLFPLVD